MTLLIDRALNAALAHASAVSNRESNDGCAALMICALSSPVGSLLLGTQDGAVALLEFLEAGELDRHVARLQARLCHEIHVGTDGVTERAIDQLQHYFAGTLREFDLPLKYRGTEFQEKVWAELRNIPYGSTCSYGAIAQRVGDSGAMRAVGAANHHNPIAIVIPCHRVVNANGDLGGYGGGVWRKRWLLDLELGQRQLLL